MQVERASFLGLPLALAFMTCSANPVAMPGRRATGRNTRRELYNVRLSPLLNNSRERMAAGCVDVPEFLFACGGIVPDLPLVLVIEDEYPLQGLVEEALTEGGFAVDVLSSGEEALTLFRSGTKPFRALVTDVNLKDGLSGWEVARLIRQEDAAFPVVYMTGAAADRWASQGVPNSVLLQKPFAPAQLVTAVSQLLNTPPVA